MKNGRGDDDHDPKLSRIEDERRRQQRGEGARPRTPGPTKPTVRSGSLKEWLIGAVIVAMAVGFVASLLVPLLRPLAN